MSKFTEGKWIAEAVYGDHFIVLANRRTVADCFSSEANARLIAHAPEMYGLIVDALQACKSHEVYACLMERAEKLLARIDGESASDEPA